MKEKVTYNKIFGILLLIGAVFIIGVSFLIGFSLNTVTGIILFVIGILYLNASALEYTEDELELKNLYGWTVKKYSFVNDKVIVRDGALYANESKIRVASFVLNKTELYQLHNFISKKNI